MNSLIVAAAGVGARMGAGKNKLLLTCEGEPLIYYTLRNVLSAKTLSELILVTKKEERPFFEALLQKLEPHIPVKWALGGATRLDSVKSGLAAVAEESDKVLIHDGARPFVDGETIDTAFNAISQETPAVMVGIPAVDTMKKVEGSQVVETVDRSQLARAQTPQGGWTVLFRKCMAALTSAVGITDDASVFEKAGVPVKILRGSESFFKVTTPADWQRFVHMVDRDGPPFRVGQGYDIHRFAADRPLMLGGVRISDRNGLLGHSDADVLLHAIMDALLGAAGLPDIGHFFPDTDDAFLGADSAKLLAKVGEAVAGKGYAVGNIDSTVIAQKPKLAPYIEEMKDRIAAILSISKSQIGIKAKTNEKLDAVGNEEGIAALADVLLYRK